MRVIVLPARKPAHGFLIRGLGADSLLSPSGGRTAGGSAAGSIDGDSVVGALYGKMM